MNDKPEATYRLARQWVLRMTGFPVEQMLALRSPALGESCDRILAAEESLDRARAEVLAALEGLTGAADSIRKRISSGRPLDGSTEGLPERASSAIDAYREAATRAEEANRHLESIHDDEFAIVRRRLYASAREERYRHALLLSSPGLEALSNPPDPDAPLPKRNTDWRQREATWASYLQRFTMKNETISFFGPSAWGTVEPESPVGADIELDDAEIDRRVVYFERGVSDAIAAKIAGELPGFEPGPLPITTAPFDELRMRLEAAPSGPSRDTWLARLDDLEALRAEFERVPDLAVRRRLLASFDERLDAWGVERTAGKGLYSSRLPVNEDCRRAARKITVGRAFVEQAVGDLTPWYELWRDLAGLYMTRLFDGLSAVVRTLGPRPRLAEFFAAAAKAGFPIARTGGAGLFPAVDEELQQAWQAQLGERWSQSEVELTEDDLAFVRRRFQFRRMKDGDIPAPDLHYAAPDRIAAREGRGTVILGEIHPDFTLWQHVFSVFCPDTESMASDYRDRHRPAFLFGRHLSEMGAHTSLPRAAMGGWSALAPFGSKGVPSWKPEDLFVELTDDDVLVRHDDGRLLGSLLHTWNVALNTHRLEFFGTAHHSPRLRVGRVVVQRESWLIDPGDRVRKEVHESGPRLLVGIRRMQRANHLPREVFVRPVLSSRMTLHKDAKPIFVDFDVPFSVEMLGGMVRKFLQLRVAEVQPRLEDAWLQDSRGRYCSEFRMIANPA